MTDRTEYMRNYMREYRKNNKRHRESEAWSQPKRREREYLERPIIFVDGEGYNVTSGPNKGEHRYYELAATGVPPLVDKLGIPSRTIFQYLWENLSDANLNVIYGGSYDFNMWIKDLSAEQAYRLYYGDPTYGKGVSYYGFVLRWMPGKYFEITRDSKRVTIRDQISFYQRPFIQACDEYLGEYEGRDELVTMKARRGAFRPDELEAVTHYNDLELRLGVRLHEEFRERANRVGLRPTKWYGPGDLSKQLMRKNGVYEAMDKSIPASVAEAARYAYAGGRFEPIQYGYSTDEAFEYDLNSAYPAAMRELPDLTTGTWLHHDGEPHRKLSRFTLYKVTWEGIEPHHPQPIFVRHRNGSVSFPLRAGNWVWTPEYEVAREYAAKVPGTKLTVLETWEYSEPQETHPFDWINKVYEERARLKAAGDGAQIALKLAANSIYGCLAQQTGARRPSHNHPEWTIPKSHQLEWAGYVTSWCRAQVLRAALQDLDAVIAFETDALFTTRPLDLTIGEGLGEWEETRFSSLSYVQSGHYYGTAWNEKKKRWEEVAKMRGVDRGEITRAGIEEAMKKPYAERFYDAKLTRFFGAGIALARGYDRLHCRWVTEPKRLNLMPMGKRVHSDGCDDERGLTPGWHRTIVPPASDPARPYPVKWINPDPNMTELEELRELEVDYENGGMIG